MNIESINALEIALKRENILKNYNTATIKPGRKPKNCKITAQVEEIHV